MLVSVSLTTKEIDMDNVISIEPDYALDLHEDKIEWRIDSL